jgi:hypothetical protein
MAGVGGAAVDAGSTAVVARTFVEVFGAEIEGIEVDEGVWRPASTSFMGGWFDGSKNIGDRDSLKARGFKD